jgi:aspartate ammonia-lyase
MSEKATRTEHDLLGKKAVPADAYYGVQTARALENFHISGVELHLYPDFIKALAMVKLAAARANFECGQFSREILGGMEGACGELIDGKLQWLSISIAATQLGGRPGAVPKPVTASQPLETTRADARPRF